MVAPPRATRRVFLRGTGAAALLGGSSALLAACGGGGGRSVPNDRTTSDTGLQGGADVDLLNLALDREHTAIAAYTASSPLLTGEPLRAARHFLAQEHAHAARLRTTIARLGGTPAGPRRSYDFGAPRTQRDVLRLLEQVEQNALDAYLEVIPRLGDGTLRAQLAAILATEAEHLTVVRQRLGETAVPDAFATAGP